MAAIYGRYECMDLLLRHGASPEVRDIDSPSLLEYASASGSIETVKLLLTHGLDVNEKNCLMPLSVDETSSTNQYEFNYPRVYISQPGSRFSCYHDSYGSPMHAAAAYGHTEVVKLLVENNAAINERSVIDKIFLAFRTRAQGYVELTMTTKTTIMMVITLSAMIMMSMGIVGNGKKHTDLCA